MIDFGVQTRGDWERICRVASWAEARGLKAIALPDHYLQRGDESVPAWDHLTHLAALATRTRLELVSLVSPITFRHPAVLYKIGVTIDRISNGRFTLGIGTGWMDEEFELFGIPYPPLAERFQHLEEAMAYIRAAITPGPNGYQGKHYTLADFDPQPQAKNLRLLGGGLGNRKARRITALYADEYNLSDRSPGKYREIREETTSMAVNAGRTPDAISWSATGPALAARKESDYRKVLHEMALVTGQSPERLEELAVEKNYPHGSGRKAAEMVQALAEAGCQRYYIQIFAIGLDNLDIILESFQP